MERIRVDSRFDNPCPQTVEITSIIQETEKAVKIKCKRVITPAKEDGNGFYCPAFQDEIWVPKSAITNGKIQDWFVKKENILSA